MAHQLRVAVYLDVGVPPQVVRGSLATLKLIFRRSEIDIDVAVGELSTDEATLVISSNVTSPLQERMLACRARRDIAARIRQTASSGVPLGVLGVAQPFAARGLNVQVYYDRIVAAATTRALAPAYVLAHAIAHEIGHVLLRSTSHKASGIMNSVWGASEYRWMATGLMLFDAGETKRMLNVIDGRDGCSATSAQPVTPLPSAWAKAKL
jgi:hypothetical protein